MNLDDYQNRIRRFAIYPDAMQKTLPELMYLGLGLVDEAGEVAGKVKKLYRDTTFTSVDEMPIEKQVAIIAEMGDVLWYLTRLADAFDIGIEEIAELNYEKLSDREKRDVLSGDGDNR